MHRIRLRDPWVTEPHTPLTYSRVFNTPTGLSARQIVLLVIECQKGVVLREARLNEKLLPKRAGATGVYSVEIRELLVAHNRLLLTFASTADNSDVATSSSPLPFTKLAQVHLAIQDDLG